MSRPLHLRGREAKERFATTHMISCLGHLMLLPGQSRKCCCGDEITSEYFIFSYVALKRAEESSTMFAGPGCGKAILELARLDAPPLVDFFSEPSSSNFTGRGQNAGTTSGSVFARFSPKNREMYVALSLLFSIWEKIREGKMKNCFEFIVRNPQMDVFDSSIFALNRCIASTAKNAGHSLTLTEMITQIASQSAKRPRKFKFEILRTILESDPQTERIWL